MATSKPLRAALIVMSAAILSAVAFAGPASAAGSAYPPSAPTQVLGVSVTAVVPAATAAVPATTASTGLAFTGTNAIGIGALGGLLLVGGGAMVVAGRRRKVNS